MMDFFSFIDNFFAFYLAKSAWELLAVFLAIAYLALAMKENNWCWPAALISTIIYIFLFWDVSLVMDSLLQVYYMLMAIYGWWMWRSKNQENNSINNGVEAASVTSIADEQIKNTLKISNWPWSMHVLAISSVLVISGVSGFFLSKNTAAAWPFLDSFTTWGSVLTTYMVAKKILENWLYWIVIDSVAVFVYIERGLYPTAGLFIIYVGMVIYGYFVWKKIYNEENKIVAEPISS
ncbi:nicotinamide riboside transporter PnuC [Agarilytica rhodophyticola]|uniref:nicotinamide riboside transporter PnuC n=1 Tax=Agarilytica rhodophyticola TaxID=1737490 RepID=UPI001FE2E8DD|nr:nicotinamide riboside transporter PnuC [Agarilytica rhodophyticola]